MPKTLPLRDIAVEVIKNLPATSSLEEIMYQLNFVAKILNGLEQEAEGELITTEQLLEQVKTWQPK